MKIKDFVDKYDTENQFEVLVNSYKQIEYAWNNKIDLSSLKKIKFSNIIVSGLGGSAIAGDLLYNFLKDELKIPYLVNRNYIPPLSLNKATLFIASSYSGNTEETIEALNIAIKKKCNVVCITSRGKIKQIAKKNKLPVIQLQSGFQPRYALGLSFFSLLKIFQVLGIIKNHDLFVKKVIRLWKMNGKEYSKENNFIIKLAEGLIGFIPIIYSAADFNNAIGLRLKSQFNENAKLPAFTNVIPEYNHNEIVGWETYSEDQIKAKVINITDKNYHSKIKKRFDITSELIRKKGIDIINLKSNQNSFKERLLDLVFIVDWLSYYTAILRRKNPSEIDNIIILKRLLIQ
jgi:glucose/mannose-6-phosphate isomerase